MHLPRMTAAALQHPERLYYQASIVNGGQTGSLFADPECTFIDNRSTPLLARGTDFKCACVRFAIDGGTKDIPIHIPQIAVGQADPWRTTYQVSLQYTWRGVVGAGPLGGVTVVAGSNQLVLYSRDGGGVRIGAGLVASIPPAVYANAAAFAAALQTAVQTTGDPAWAGATVSTCLNGRLVLTPPASPLGVQLGVRAVNAAAGLLLGCAAGTVVWAPAAAAQLVLQNRIALPGAGIVKSFAATATRAVHWVPENAGGMPPSPPLTAVEYDNSQYWLYSYAHFAAMVSNAMAWSVNDLSAPENSSGAPTAACLEGQFAAWWGANGGGDAFPGVAAAAPSLLYSASSGLFTLLGDAAAVGATPTSAGAIGPAFAETMVVRMNEPLRNLLGNWPAVIAPDNWASIRWEGAAASAVVGGSQLALTQDYPSDSALWSPVDAISFTSSLLGARNQCVAPPIAYGTSNLAAGTSQAQFEPIVFDIKLPLGRACNWREMVSYQPPYLRWLDLQSDVPVTSIDFQVAWRNRLTNTPIPLTLPPSASASIVLLFQRRGLA